MTPLRESRALRFALAVIIGGFAIGAFNHARDFLAFGLRPYRGPSLALELFWSSLLVLDLLVVVLLLSGRRRSGLALAAAIMIADVGINSHTMQGHRIDASATPLLLQAIFLGFVLGAIGFLWPARSAPPPAGLPPARAFPHQ